MADGVHDLPNSPQRLHNRLETPLDSSEAEALPRPDGILARELLLSSSDRRYRILLGTPSWK